MAKAPEVKSGFLAKRKRKKLQGFAKRWVVLDENGLLSYSVEPNKRPRETIRVSLATIARSARNRDIHIDCGSTLWHFKAYSDADFESWTVALRRFITVNETEAFSGSAAKNRKSHRTKSGGGQNVAVVGSEQPQIDFDGLSDIVNSMASSLKDAFTAQEGLNESESKADKAKTKLKIFGGSKKEGDSAQGQAQADLDNALRSLRHEHDRLSALVANALGVELGSSGGYSAAAFASRNAIGLKSLSSSFSEEGDDSFQDAREYNLDELHGASQSEGNESSVPDEDSSAAEDSSTDATSADEDDDDEDSDGTYTKSKKRGIFARKKSSGGKSDKSDKEGEKSGGEAGGDDEYPKDDGVKRRKELPHGNAGDEGSIFSVLKKNMGKDMSKISMPISFNEPISALERLAEDFQYVTLLHKAAKTEDSMERLALVAAWVVSGYSAGKLRGSRKPFNPMLGETYELIRDDLGFKFVAEKVSHHPPIMAAYAEGKGWTYNSDSGGKQKFWGRSMEYMPDGHATLKFTELDVEYEIKERPSVFVRNIMSGEKYIEQQGDLKIESSEGEKATIHFKEGGWGGGSKNKVEGELKSSDGKSAKLEGRWDEQLSRKEGNDNYKRLWECTEFPKNAKEAYGFSTFAIQLNETTENIKDKLPPTDSRKRPDQSAFEEGKVDEAEELKHKLEQAQRDRRSEWEKSGSGPKPPQFFKQSGGKAWKFNDEYFKKRENGEWAEDVKIFET